MEDVINPKHYQKGVQAIDIILAAELDFCQGNVVKYIFRAGDKPENPASQDLDKAEWYYNKSRQKYPEIVFTGHEKNWAQKFGNIGGALGLLAKAKIPEYKIQEISEFLYRGAVDFNKLRRWIS